MKYVMNAGLEEVTVDDLVIVYLETKKSYVFDGVAGLIWRMLKEDVMTEAIVARITMDYEVTPSEASSDLQEFLLKLAEIGIVHVIDN